MKITKTKFSKLISAVLIIVVGLMISCTDTVTVKLPTKPEALAAYDNSSAGIVKGILVGSTGTFKFSIKNGNDSIYCRLTFDGQTATLFPPTSLSSWTPGQAFAAIFSGLMGSIQVSVYFKCDANGGNPTATFTIPNHNIVVSIYKETSTTLVKGYEGTYITTLTKDGSESDRGIFNFIECNEKVYGTHTTTSHTTDPRYTGPSPFAATVVNGKLTLTDSSAASFDISETTVSGSFISADGTEKTTITGKRTL